MQPAPLTARGSVTLGGAAERWVGRLSGGRTQAQGSVRGEDASSQWRGNTVNSFTARGVGTKHFIKVTSVKLLLLC